MSLTKKGVVDQFHNELGFSKNQSIEIVEYLLKIIKSNLESGEDVLISGFGKFCVKEKGERKARNLATGEALMLPARWIVRFKCSGKLREKVNGGKHVR